MYSILFITTSSLATNPRLIKEIDLLKDKKNIKVIAFNIGGWSTENDVKILSEFENISIKFLSAIRKPFSTWLFSNLIYITANLFVKIFNHSLLLNALSHNKRTFLIMIELLLNKKKYKCDLIICHNLGSLYPGYILSKKINAKLAFDMEDYHPGELIDDKNKNEKKIRESILKEILPKCVYVSFATDGLLKLTNEHLTNQLNKTVIVYNTFSTSEFIQPKRLNDRRIKFVWFSQTIGKGRGLELFFEAIKNTDTEYEITLIGNFNDAEFEKELKQQQNLLILPPLTQIDLHKKLSEFDIGLSLELNKTDLNRNYALTNKLFAYLLAGLYVLATDTPAQKEFFDKNPEFGILCGQDSSKIAEGIRYIIQNIDDIRKSKIERFNKSKKFSWENESRKLTEIWKEILK